MQALANELLDLKPFVQQQKPFLLIYGSCDTMKMGQPLLHALGAGRTIIASGDPFFARDFVKPSHHPRAFADAYRRGVTLPHYAHSLAHLRAPAGRQGMRRGMRARTGLMFHGGLGRYDHGLRPAMLQVMESMRLRHADVGVDVKTGEMTRGKNRSDYNVNSYEHSAQSYLDASMCLVPSGDVPSSRRLFDAMAAGCVPVLVRSFYRLNADKHQFTTSLPFPHSIDWTTATLWMSPAVRMKSKALKEECDASMASWLRDWHTRSKCDLEATRQRALSAFSAHLDFDHNPEGIIWALLRELEVRFRACNQGPRSEPPLGSGTIDDPHLCPYSEQARKGASLSPSKLIAMSFLPSDVAAKHRTVAAKKTHMKGAV